MDRGTSAKSASGARIGITSAAWPEDDGTRKAIGMFTTKARIPKPASEASCDGLLHPVQDGVGHVGVLHHDRDAAGEHDDQRGAEEVGRARPRSS